MVELRETARRGVFTDGQRLLTLNADRGQRVYGEDLVASGGAEYRAWDQRRSKLAAAILNGLEGFELREDSRVLYLGAASGTTASHVADICAGGHVFCVEVAPRPFRDLVALCERRRNMHPIMADAGQPLSYSPVVQSADFVYQDIAQRDQVEIFAKNVDALPPASGEAILVVKARSIDVSANPAKIFAKVESALAGKGLAVAQRVDLAPYEKDHEAMLVKL